ncbi:MAG: ABC transporter permease [Thermoplasmata archaeon]|jgi:peptide/nickel transport system permease protein|nr:ABC transporter permease [Thermoplasmata archaeon]
MAKKSFRGIFARRVLNVVITMFGILSLNFALIHAMPGDPINNMVPKDPKFDDSIKWDLVDRFHLNDSLPQQYVYYVYNTVTLDWGVSYMAPERKVLDIILGDLRWTLLLVGVSTAFTIVIGILVGAYSAYKRGGAFDVGATSFSLFFYGMPVFWFALLLQLLFTSHPLGMVWWPQFPPGGYFDTDAYGGEFTWSLPVVLSVMKYMFLPAVTLTLAMLATVSLVMRSSLIDVMTDDFIMTARAKGLSNSQILTRHAMPNGMPPMIALIAMEVAFVIGGAYQVEVIFKYPGIGWRTIKAIGDLDFPILQYIVVIGGVAVVIANFLADIVLLYIDPRIRIS